MEADRRMQQFPYGLRLDEFVCNPAASEIAIASARAQVPFNLPEDYWAFLRVANGGEGWVGENYLMLDAVEELLSLNEWNLKSEPGYFAFGSNGGGETFTFVTRPPATAAIGMTPGIGDAKKDTIVIAETFAEFFQVLAGKDNLLR